MAYHLHDVRDLISSDDASPLALSTDLCWHAILVGLEYGGLVQTDRRRVNIHIAENDVGVR